MLAPDSDLSPGFDPIEEWLVDFDSTMSAVLEAKSLGTGEEVVVLHALEATTACGLRRRWERSLAMVMAEAATFPPVYKLLPTVSSSDAVEAGVEWTELGDEAKAGDALEEVGEEEGELVATGEEDSDLEMDYPTVVEPPEEAKVYIGNLPYDVDSKGLALLFKQASVFEIAEVRVLSLRLSLSI
jgi:hypothetical protein